MFGIIDIGTYIIGTILIVILPGPNSLYVMAIASRFGIKTGYWGALGVFTGDLILILCTVLGAASLLHPFRSALTISLLNPKAILFYLSFFVQFVDPNYAYPALSFALLSIILQIISMAYLSILIFSGIKLASYFNRQFKVAAVAVATVGLLFCGFGLKLALSTL